MKKKLVVVMLACFMAFSVAACGNVKDENTKVSKDKDDKDDKDDDDKSSKRDDKNDKDDKDGKNDKDDKDDKDGKNDKDDKDDVGTTASGHSANDDDDDDGTYYLEIPDEVFGDFTVDPEYVSTEYYDEATGIMTVSDYDGNEIIDLYLPDGYVVTFASEFGAAFDINNTDMYFDQISIDYKETLYISDYLRDGKTPKDSDIEDYTVDYTEYVVDGLEFIIAYESYYSIDFDDTFDYCYILVPYMDGNTKEYVSICLYYDKTPTEVNAIATQMLGL